MTTVAAAEAVGELVVLVLVVEVLVVVVVVATGM